MPAEVRTPRPVGLPRVRRLLSRFPGLREPGVRPSARGAAGRPHPPGLRSAEDNDRDQGAVTAGFKALGFGLCLFISGNKNFDKPP